MLPGAVSADLALPSYHFVQTVLCNILSAALHNEVAERTYTTEEKDSELDSHIRIEPEERLLKDVEHSHSLNARKLDEEGTKQPAHVCTQDTCTHSPHTQNYHTPSHSTAQCTCEMTLPAASEVDSLSLRILQAPQFTEMGVESRHAHMHSDWDSHTPGPCCDDIPPVGKCACGQPHRDLFMSEETNVNSGYAARGCLDLYAYAQDECDVTDYASSGPALAAEDDGRFCLFDLDDDAFQEQPLGDFAFELDSGVHEVFDILQEREEEEDASSDEETSSEEEDESGGQEARDSSEIPSSPAHASAMDRLRVMSLLALTARKLNRPSQQYKVREMVLLQATLNMGVTSYRVGMNGASAADYLSHA